MITSMNFSTKILWLLSFFNFGILLVYILGPSIGLSLTQMTLLKLFMMLFPILILFLHAVVTIGARKGIGFILWAFLVGFVGEVWGTRYGTIFGGRYIYPVTPFTTITLLGVPLMVVFYWGTLTYAGYATTNALLLWLNKSKILLQKNGARFLPIIIVCDALIVLSVDLFMDPVEVKEGMWTWLNKGAYFGVPIGNFIGWFFVALFASGTFRVFEHYFCQPSKKKIARAKPSFLDQTINLIPAFGYGSLLIYFVATALRANLFAVAAIGSAFMLPVVLLNWGLFLRWARNYLTETGSS